ncbi:histidinol-phosphate transaminase [Legionella hackeliae]|uniref:histidinol-phosphate transaminase n=1 Tax=Legionella hackeliae TaxID=449 RepID=A0A0A8UUI7_LEGHA|nr:histidinol-phosphate transaminase [Legionella hackeliae]KTD13750.1 Histidinol-phosphate aminotransferase (Imidazole acetol-phosphate transaminase) [Legionella hackeliae]CEK10449.1 Histidinol-phosphate aminotransferase 1 [Legionella hackeliae]STX47185.1 Histidinol-phosphate aminotransferase (Imidazole acetol-phosphate transaminase) [Legionella hackeliae]
MSVLDLIRPDLRDIKPYIPTGDELGVRLHANELPWSPITFNQIPLNHYPKALQQQQVQELMADYFTVKSQELVLTRGSDDGIDLIMRLFLRAGTDSILQCPPTFPMYAFYARLQQAQVLNCPLESENNFQLSTEKLIDTWQPNCKLIMVCRPNNPTGSMLGLQKIAGLCDYFTNKAVIVVDEAYIDFSETESAATLLSSFDNLIILRTLSKACGLAGLRLGAVIAQPQLIQAIRNSMPPYTLSSAVIALAKNALANKEWFATNIQYILNARKSLITKLQQSPWIETIYPSHTNFILVASSHAQSLSEWFAKHDIAVRHFAHRPLEHMMRITVGDERQNERLLDTLNSFKP